MNIEITKLRREQVKRLSNFAKTIWYEHYTAIIGKKQVDYMLNKFQSPNAISNQIESGYQYFQVTEQCKLIGYFSIHLREKASLFISKFYLVKETRGKGVGKKMLHYIEQFAILRQCKTIDLTVNKYNPAYNAYLKLGFIKTGAVEFDIGAGYVMDDYLMSKALD